MHSPSTINLSGASHLALRHCGNSTLGYSINPTFDTRAPRKTNILLRFTTREFGE
jgi:hypothetical protein